jgi:hypothetical protein
MPRATIDTEPVKKDLKSAPPDGFVTIRRMPYGNWLHRTDMAMDLSMKMSGKAKNQEVDARASMANEAVTVYEFAQCIVEHNLTNHADELLDFSSTAALKQLDPQIGAEISEYIRELHEFDSGNSPAG